MALSDAWSDIIRANWVTCQLFIDLRKGSYADLSANARSVTLTNAGAGRPPQWPNQTQGKGLDVGGTSAAQGGLSVPHAAELNLNPSGTIACFSRNEFGMAANSIYAVKRTGAVTSYQMYERSAAGSLGLYDGTTAHVLGAYSISTTRSLVSSFTVGAFPTGYVNGVLMSPPAGLWAPGDDAGPAYMANSSTFAAGSPGAGWHCFLFFSARLTGAEISQLHNDFMESAHYL